MSVPGPPTRTTRLSARGLRILGWYMSAWPLVFYGLKVFMDRDDPFHWYLHGPQMAFGIVLLWEAHRVSAGRPPLIMP